MAEPSNAEAQKRAAAIAAVAEVEPGMVVGLGTGTTASYAIMEVARRVREGLIIRAVATSKRTGSHARQAGIEVIDFDGMDTIDLAIDGVDEIDLHLRAIKGGGGAMLREKIVANAAHRMIAIADASKRVASLGARPVPLEVLPMAAALVQRRIREIGGEPSLRTGSTGPLRTDQGNCVIDCRFAAAIEEPARLADRLSRIPGVLGHGLFLDEIDTIYVGTASGVVRCDRPRIS
jgi:ribose 5-phosphate isomerase A